jgi:hypothetical protein
MNSEKKRKRKRTKKGYCERSGFQLRFFALFHSSFGSLHPFHAVWVFLWFVKGQIAPQVFKKDWGEFSEFYSSLGYIYLQNMKKGAKKGAKKDAKEGYGE